MDQLTLLALLKNLQDKVNTVTKQIGPQGPIGETGAVGPTGDSGAQGIQGERGPAGERGSDGLSGPQGADGPIGETGVGVQSVSQAADGDLVFTLTDGTEEVVELPYGLQGPSKGDGTTRVAIARQGEGPQGPDGADGAEGPQGPIGPEGPAGADGAQGEQGPVGPEGPTAVSTDADNTAVLGTDNLIYVPEVPDNSVINGKAAALNLQQALLADDGQPAKTILAVAATNTGKVQGVSLGDGNVIEVYSTGADFNAGNILYREFMSAGEPIAFTGLAAGAIITSTEGFYGCGEQVQSGGNNESPMPLLSLGLAFTSSFVFCFRNAQDYPGQGDNTGQIIIVNGPLPSTVTFSTGAGLQVQDQVPRDLEPFELSYFYADGNGEYFIESTSPVMAATQSLMGSDIVNNGNVDTPLSRFYDCRLIMPLTNDGITWPRLGNVSAPYAGTESTYYVRDGATGAMPTISPGFPVDFDSSAATGADDEDYEPNGATRLRAVGLVSAYSGADSSGLEATPLMPVKAMSQIVAQPFWIVDTGDGGNSGVAIASPYQGTAKYFEWNDLTGKAELAYTVELNRGANGTGPVSVITPDDQYFPCAGMIANEPTLAADPSVVQLVGRLAPGYIVSDVPITVVSQNGTPTYNPIIRSQNGTTTISIVTDDDETLQLGWTPDTLRAEVLTDEDGFLRIRKVDNTGAVTYRIA
jgi:hypothetical protein